MKLIENYIQKQSHQCYRKILIEQLINRDRTYGKTRYNKTKKNSKKMLMRSNYVKQKLNFSMY